MLSMKQTYSAYKRLVKKGPRKTAKVVYNEEMLKRKPIDQLKKIAKLRGIKNKCEFKKKTGLITSLSKSEISNAERNYLKYFNSNTSNNTNASNNTNTSNASNNTNTSNITNASNNTNAGNNTNDDTYDGTISDIRAILSRLANVVTKNDREKIKKELYEIENKINLSDKEKEKIDYNLLELVNKLNKKEKYIYNDWIKRY